MTAYTVLSGGMGRQRAGVNDDRLRTAERALRPDGSPRWCLPTPSPRDSQGLTGRWGRGAVPGLARWTMVKCRQVEDGGGRWGAGAASSPHVAQPRRQWEHVHALPPMETCPSSVTNCASPVSTTDSATPCAAAFSAISDQYRRRAASISWSSSSRPPRARCARWRQAPEQYRWSDLAGVNFRWQVTHETRVTARDGLLPISPACTTAEQPGKFDHGQVRQPTVVEPVAARMRM